jgi:hypothetical protein
MKDLKNVQIGDKLKIIKRGQSNHGFIIGSIVEVYQLYNKNGVYARNDQGQSYLIYASEVELNTPKNKEELAKDLAEAKRAVEVAQAEVDAIYAKIAYLNEIGKDEYDEVQYKAYRTLQLLKDTNKTDLEKSLIIAELIKNG